MGLFKKREPALPDYPAERYEPVLRRSICTGERVGCMRDRDTGKVHELTVLRTDADVAAFCRRYGTSPAEIRTLY